MSWRTIVITTLLLGALPRGRRLRVLVADRDEVVRIGIAAALERAGHRVVARCADAKAVLQALTGHRIDVCLISLDLPGGGVTTTRAISARPDPPRIILLASTVRERDVFAGLRAGADAFVVKDVDASSLPEHVTAVAAGEAVLPEGMTARLIDEFRSLARTSSEPTALPTTDPGGALAFPRPRKRGSS